MTKQAGHRSYIHALCNQQAGVRVPQAMHIQIQRQVVGFQNQLEAIGKCAGMQDMLYGDVPTFETVIAAVRELEKEINTL